MHSVYRLHGSALALQAFVRPGLEADAQIDAGALLFGVQAELAIIANA